MKGRLEILGEFTVSVDTRKTHLVVRGSGYAARSRYASGKYFPNRTVEPYETTIVMAHCVGAGASERWMLDEGRMRGLFLCDYEEVLFFGEQHQGEILKRPIVGLHEPHFFEGDERPWRLFLDDWYQTGTQIRIVHEAGPHFQRTAFLFGKAPQ